MIQLFILLLFLNPTNTIQVFSFFSSLRKANGGNVCLESHFCPIIRVPSTTSINNSLIDFLWINVNHFLLVNSIPSSSECHFYRIRSIKDSGGIEHVQTFSVGISPSIRKFSTPNKKISLHQPSDIIKLDQIKRIDDENNESHLIFAMKTNGDLFTLEIPCKDLSNARISEEFQGPLRILPSTFDNYGTDHGQSTFVCLSDTKYPLLISTRDKHHLNQSLVLSSSNEYSLYTIDRISLKKNPSGEMLIESIRKDPFVSNRYFLSDGKGNIYSIEISWFEQIKQGIKQFQSTRFQHLIDGKNSNQIEHFSPIQTNDNQLYLAIIVHSQTNENKVNQLTWISFF